MRKIFALISLGRDDECALLLSESDSPLFRLPNCALNRIIAAVEQEWIGEVAVVGHVDVVRAGPDEGADNGLREEESLRVACFDACDTDVRRHTNDSKSIRRRRDGTRRMGPVTMVILGGQTGNRRTRHTVDAVGNIDVWLKVGVREVDAGVDVSDEHRSAAAGYRMGLRRMD